MLMDEPFNFLYLMKQPELCSLLTELTQQEGLALIVVIHNINLAARYAEHILALYGHGRCYAMGVLDVVICEDMLKDVYGVDAYIVYDTSGVTVVPPICHIS